MEDGDDGAAAHGHKHGGSEWPPGRRAEGGDGRNRRAAETEDGDLCNSVSFAEEEESGGGGGGRAMDQYVNVSFRWHQNP